ncbi:serine/threonine-protein kinase LATS1-like [Protopterus annectens]|uniref:serine/threonine-protein kinase LATS1-like n=1 Tax=Protopterus annectens TaxID=7888 RepID=UPI001CFAD050|nr:serine/threonine-protein kinase LATS1-like [Protopterus annectens]
MNEDIAMFEKISEYDVRMFHKTYKNKIHSNMTNEEQLLFKEISNNMNIRIMRPDKGNGMVIIDSNDYSTYMTNMLLGNTYVEVSKNQVNIAFKRIDMLLDDMLYQGEISEKEHEYLYNEYPIISGIFGIPKIHKGLNNLQFRPIVDGKIKLGGSGSVQQPVNRKQSWKGSKESLVPQRHGPSLTDGVVYRSESPSPQVEMGRPLSASGVAALAPNHSSNGQRINPAPPQVRSVTPPPPPRGTTPPPPSWEPNSQTKRYSGNMDYMISRISPVPQGAWQDGYTTPVLNTPQLLNPTTQSQRGISPVPVGRQTVIIPSSSNSKFSFPSTRGGLQNGNGQSDFIAHQSVTASSPVNRQPPPPYPLTQSNRQSPTILQMQAGGAAVPPTYSNGNLPQSLMVPNRNSHNLDIYNTGPGMQASWQQSSAPSQTSPGPGSGHDVAFWQHNIPVRSNSFNSHPMGSRQTHPANSQPSATTVTAITPAPIQQPVKSMRVLKPELQTALAPSHPSWMQQSMAVAQSGPFTDGPPTSHLPVSEAPSYQGPPPPYPMHLLQQTSPSPPYESFTKPRKQEHLSSPTVHAKDEEDGEKACELSEGTEKDKKQITTSPVPVRKNKRDEERRESGIQLYSPQAFKFYMEQHVENILKSHQQRMRRKKQLENEMMRLTKRFSGV